MRSATNLYIAMVTVLIVGLWAILTLGGRLQAPHHLAGVWQVHQPGADPHAATKAFTVSQSGRFVKLHISPTEAIDLRWIGEERDARSGSHVIRLEGAGHTLAVHVGSGGDSSDTPEYRFDLGGATQHTWLAQRQDHESDGVAQSGHR